MDYIEYAKTAGCTFRLEVSESTKGPTLGRCKWGVSVWAEELQVWRPLEGQSQSSTYDKSMQEGRSSLAWWSLNYRADTPQNRVTRL